jgi:hypothetical protein
MRYLNHVPPWNSVGVRLSSEPGPCRSLAGPSLDLCWQNFLCTIENRRLRICTIDFTYSASHGTLISAPCSDGFRFRGDDNLLQKLPWPTGIWTGVPWYM